MDLLKGKVQTSNWSSSGSSAMMPTMPVPGDFKVKTSWVHTCNSCRVALSVRLLLPLLLAITCTECLLLAPHEFTSQQAHFAVDVPGIMASSTKTITVNGIGPMNILEFGSKWSSVYYSVSYIRLPASAKLDTHVLSSNEISTLTKKYARGDVEASESTIIRSKDIMQRGLLGLEMTLQTEVRGRVSSRPVVVTGWVRYFLVGDGVYEVAASLVTNDTTPAKTTEDFLNSFRVLGLTQ